MPSAASCRYVHAPTIHLHQLRIQGHCDSGFRGGKGAERAKVRTHGRRTSGPLQPTPLQKGRAGFISGTLERELVGRTLGLLQEGALSTISVQPHDQAHSDRRLRGDEAIMLRLTAPSGATVCVPLQCAPPLSPPPSRPPPSRFHEHASVCPAGVVCSCPRGRSHARRSAPAEACVLREEEEAWSCQQTGSW